MQINLVGEVHAGSNKSPPKKNNKKLLKLLVQDNGFTYFQDTHAHMQFSKYSQRFAHYLLSTIPTNGFSLSQINDISTTKQP